MFLSRLLLLVDPSIYPTIPTPPRACQAAGDPESLASREDMHVADQARLRRLRMDAQGQLRPVEKSSIKYVLQDCSAHQDSPLLEVTKLRVVSKTHSNSRVSQNQTKTPCFRKYPILQS